MYTFKRGDSGVGLAEVEWCECSAVVEEGRVANCEVMGMEYIICNNDNVAVRLTVRGSVHAVRCESVC